MITNLGALEVNGEINFDFDGIGIIISLTEDLSLLCTSEEDVDTILKMEPEINDTIH